MALIKCHECGKEISTEAKVCPQCGAKNKNRRKSKIITFGGTFILLFGIFAVYTIFEPELNPNIPACESRHGKKVFINTFDNSPYAKNNNVRALEIRSQKEISSGANPEDRVCEVTFRINDGTDKTYIISFERKESGGYIIHGKSK
jgi:predicted nucleic acid-binding Zn ribbon protein